MEKTNLEYKKRLKRPVSVSLENIDRMANHHNQTKVVIALLIAISMAIMGMVALVGAPTSVEKQGAVLPMSTNVNIQPTPVMNSNITWSTYYNGWNPLEYNNGSGNHFT